MGGSGQLTAITINGEVLNSPFILKMMLLIVISLSCKLSEAERVRLFPFDTNLFSITGLQLAYAANM